MMKAPINKCASDPLLNRPLVNNELFFCQRLAKHTLSQWLQQGPQYLRCLSINNAQQQVALGFNNARHHFQGYISNENELRQMLSLDDSSQQALIAAAIERWQCKFNQHVFGDYALVWFEPNQLIATTSARASFTLYYQRSHGVAIASDIKRLLGRDNSQLDQAQLLERISLGPMTTDKTCYGNIAQLQPGQTLQWSLCNDIKLEQQSQLSGDEQLMVAQQYRLMAATPLVPHPLSEQQLTELFNGLADLAHDLAQPLADAVLAHFDQQIAACPADTILLNEQWLTGRHRQFTMGNLALFIDGHQWCKGVLKSKLLKHKSQLRQRQADLNRAFNVETKVTQDQLMSFAQWLDLHYILPAWCQMLQSIAQRHGKTLINPFIAPQLAISLVLQAPKPMPPSYFDLNHISLANVFDAMQRLFRHGDKVTTTLFNVVPSATAKLIKQCSHRPRHVEQLCVTAITFDYLARFHRVQLSS